MRMQIGDRLRALACRSPSRLVCRGAGTRRGGDDDRHASGRRADVVRRRHLRCDRGRAPARRTAARGGNGSNAGRAATVSARRPRARASHRARRTAAAARAAARARARAAAARATSPDRSRPRAVGILPRRWHLRARLRRRATAGGDRLLSAAVHATAAATGVRRDQLPVRLPATRRLAPRPTRGTARGRPSTGIAITSAPRTDAARRGALSSRRSARAWS